MSLPTTARTDKTLAQQIDSIERLDPKIRLTYEATTYADVPHQFGIYGANVPRRLNHSINRLPFLVALSLAVGLCNRRA